MTLKKEQGVARSELSLWLWDLEAQRIRTTYSILVLLYLPGLPWQASKRRVFPAEISSLPLYYSPEIILCCYYYIVYVVV